MATEAANAARKQALAEQQKAKTMMDRVREEASRVRATTVRLQKIPALFRVIWDGFRKSRIQEHVQAAFQAELDSLRSVAAVWADRAGKPESQKRSAEERARSFERSLADGGPTGSGQKGTRTTTSRAFSSRCGFGAAAPTYGPKVTRGFTGRARCL